MSPEPLPIDCLSGGLTCKAQYACILVCVYTPTIRHLLSRVYYACVCISMCSDISQLVLKRILNLISIQVRNMIMNIQYTCMYNWCPANTKPILGTYSVHVHHQGLIDYKEEGGMYVTAFFLW